MTQSHNALGMALGLFCLIAPTAGAAQVAEACGSSETLLMHCTFDNGAKQVALCQSGDTVSYAFGRDLGRPELSLSATMDELSTVPFNRVSGSYFEQVRFYNGDTRYEVATVMTFWDSSVQGQIRVTYPDGDGPLLTCDTGSVTPNTLVGGIANIPSVAAGDAVRRLSDCINDNPNALDCLGTVQAVDIRDHDCMPGQGWTDCWAHESKVWTEVLHNEEAHAIAKATEIGGEALATQISDAQRLWRESRRLDCQLVGGLLFAPDGGLASCIAESSAARINFLEAAIGTAAFGG